MIHLAGDVAAQRIGAWSSRAMLAYLHAGYGTSHRLAI